MTFGIMRRHLASTVGCIVWNAAPLIRTAGAAELEFRHTRSQGD